MTRSAAPFTFLLPHASWQRALQSEWQKPYLIELAAFVEEEYQQRAGSIFPPQELIFNAFAATPFDQVKVVIVGQDPYHGAGQAHGLSFSVPKGIKVPPSLQNIFKELHSDLHLPIPSHGCLLDWAKQGVLLLNATLTVREGEPLSHHGRGWELFTDSVIHYLEQRPDPLAFLLWGKSAQDKGRFLHKESSPHLILKAAHPSPYSAHQGFLGCRHFSRVNDWLASQGKKPIDWSLK